MERMGSRERELDVDLESGGTASGEDRTNDHVCDSRQHNKLVDRFGFGRSVNTFVVEVVHNEDLVLLIDRRLEGEEGQHHAAYIDKRHAVEKPKTQNTKKAAKPPRPPKGPMLDPVDQKLMQEISELAMRKRARIERFKALKKTRATKSSSWNSSLTALVITVLFCLILIFQGVFSRNNGIIDLHVSPRPAVAGSDLISVQFYDNYSPDERGISASDSPSWASSRVSGSASSRKA